VSRTWDGILFDIRRFDIRQSAVLPCRLRRQLRRQSSRQSSRQSLVPGVFARLGVVTAPARAKPARNRRGHSPTSGIIHFLAQPRRGLCGADRVAPQAPGKTRVRRVCPQGGMGGAILPVCAAHDNAADEPVSRVLFTARAATRIPPNVAALPCRLRRQLCRQLCRQSSRQSSRQSLRCGVFTRSETWPFSL
jgi:hypothetical protein